MSNVYDLFPDKPDGQPAVPADAPHFGSCDTVFTQPLETAHQELRRDDAPSRIIVMVGTDATHKLETAALQIQRTSYSILVQSLSTLMLDENFQMPEDNHGIDLTDRAQGFQLKKDFFETLAEFSDRHHTTPDILSHLAVARYVIIGPGQYTKGPLGPKRRIRHLRSV